MQEIIYRIDNFSIVKILGGIALIMAFISKWLAKIIADKISQSSQHSFDSKLESIKGEISKSNSIVSSIIGNHFTTSQKLIDKKLTCYEETWKGFLKMQSDFPSSFSLINQIYADSELRNKNMFDHIVNNDKLNVELFELSEDVIFNAKMLHFSQFSRKIDENEPYLSGDLYRLFYVYNTFLTRTIFGMVQAYKKRDFYFWKDDDAIKEILELVLSEDELSLVEKAEVHSFRMLTDLLKFKITKQFRNDLGIKESLRDSIKHITEMEKAYERRL